MGEFSAGLLQLPTVTCTERSRRERHFHDSLALESELDAEVWPSCFWEVLNENLLGKNCLS